MCVFSTRAVDLRPHPSSHSPGAEIAHSVERDVSCRRGRPRTPPSARSSQSGRHPQSARHPQSLAPTPGGDCCRHRGLAPSNGMEPFLGTEALARGDLTRGRLRWNYRAIHPDVYIAKDQARTVQVNTYAAWLWTGRTGIIAGSRRRSHARRRRHRALDAHRDDRVAHPAAARHRHARGADRRRRGAIGPPADGSPPRPGPRSTWADTCLATWPCSTSTSWLRRAA